MKPKVFITKPISKKVEKYIGEHCDYKIWREEKPIPEELFTKEISDIDGLMTPKAYITEQFLTKAPKLKVVSHISAGYDTFDIDAMQRRKVIGTHTPYVLDETVADLTFGIMIMTARKLSEFDRYVKNKKWKKNDNQDFFGKDVHHSTLGIFGMGRIGEKIVRRAVKGFNMEVIYNNRHRRLDLENEYGVEYREKDILLENADFILSMLPLTEQTFHFFDKEEFKMMKTDALFFNCSRGQVVNEKALTEALINKEIAGAGLDVFEEEPIDLKNPLLEMKNVVTTPHMASATKEARECMAMRAAENLVAGVTGHVPRDVVKELKGLII
ncbi:2-hydroxyacid dehydrogenase [Oceanobacillus locisalsi]|uniref:2-hydroxyacid dehydrogenase n=1 Tax=Oceanobacillus locisalsi TaxID=546107 RepID=A0ABW3NH98_9BACI